jgi:hypothetical protein
MERHIAEGKATGFTGNGLANPTAEGHRQMVRRLRRRVFLHFFLFLRVVQQRMGARHFTVNKLYDEDTAGFIGADLVEPGFP